MSTKGEPAESRGRARTAATHVLAIIDQPASCGIVRKNQPKFASKEGGIATVGTAANFAVDAYTERKNYGFLP